MAAAAGRVDDPEAVREAFVAVRWLGVEAELLDRRVERVVEDELLDELGRLQQRVLLTDARRTVFGRGRPGSGCSTQRR